MVERKKQAVELYQRHKGKHVVTAWRGLARWERCGLKRGVTGTIVGWDIDGPQVKVDDDRVHESTLPIFYPGARADHWGIGVTWRFTTKSPQE